MIGKLFPMVGKFLAVFPMIGKKVSNHWKTLPRMLPVSRPQTNPYDKTSHP
jgi:hypothetical protein